MNAYPNQQAAPAPKKSNKPLIIVVVIVLILCCLCSILIIGGAALYNYSSGSITNIGEVLGITFQPSENNPQGTAEPVATPQKPVLELPNLFGVKLGDKVRCEKCGFSFNKVLEYEYKEEPDWGFLSMAPAGASSYTGPYIALIGSATDKPTSYDEVIAKLKEDTTFVYSNEKNIIVGGVKAYSMDVDSTVNGIAIKGRLVGGLVNPNQIFQIVGVSPADQWDVFRPIFDAVTKSLSFFEPVRVPTPTPTSQP